MHYALGSRNCFYPSSRYICVCLVKKKFLLLYTILVPIGVILLKFVTYSSSYAIENSGNTVYCISHLLMAQKFTCIIIRWSVSITVCVLQRKQGTVRVIKSA